jgi:hypothetical protein
LDNSHPGTTVGVLQSGQLPKSFELGQNYPNPFNPITQINYSVPRSSFITLKVYNLLGQVVTTLFEGIRQPGNYEAIFDGSKLVSGVYLYRLVTNPSGGSNPSISSGHVFVETKKLVLLK